jgi:hypothetical protein
VNTLCKISWLDFASVEWHLFRLHNEAKFTTIRKRKNEAISIQIPNGQGG